MTGHLGIALSCTSGRKKMPRGQNPCWLAVKKSPPSGGDFHFHEMRGYSALVGLEAVLLAVEGRDVARHELVALDDETYEVERLLR